MIREFLGEVFKCPHTWRRMTSERDYGRHGSPHWGCYGGCEQEICKLCGITRVVRGWQQWKYELDDAVSRVGYLMNTEPPKDTK